MVSAPKRQWYIRTSNNGCKYLWYRYSNTRCIYVRYDEDNPCHYVAEVRAYTKNHGTKRKKLYDMRGYTCEFDSIDAAFAVANDAIYRWDNPVTENIDIVNSHFERYAALKGISEMPINQKES